MDISIGYPKWNFGVWLYCEFEREVLSVWTQNFSSWVLLKGTVPLHLSSKHYSYWFAKRWLLGRGFVLSPRSHYKSRAVIYIQGVWRRNTDHTYINVYRYMLNLYSFNLFVHAEVFRLAFVSWSVRFSSLLITTAKQLWMMETLFWRHISFDKNKSTHSEILPLVCLPKRSIS